MNGIRWVFGGLGRWQRRGAAVVVALLVLSLGACETANLPGIDPVGGDATGGGAAGPDAAAGEAAAGDVAAGDVAAGDVAAGVDAMTPEDAGNHAAPPDGVTVPTVPVLPCRTHCDCPQGLACAGDGRCVVLSVPTYCCGSPGCPPGAACLHEDGEPAACAEGGPVEPVCGNGDVEPGETCDGDCPAACDDGDPCTTGALTGAAGSCNVVCHYRPVTVCDGGDGCCPTGCDAAADADCRAVCGNGAVEPGETCDGDCPAVCDDGDECTEDQFTGSAATCSASCRHAAVTTCGDGDGCCPEGCTLAIDADCVTDGRVGAPCADDRECHTGDCLFAWTGGYCTRACDPQNPCPIGTHCALLSGAQRSCVTDCRSDGECEREGYACYDYDRDSVAECAPFGAGTGRVGDPCDEVGDCTGGGRARCLPHDVGWFHGGYCTLRCGAGEGCPYGSHCALEDDGVGVCLASCDDDDVCRNVGYLCHDVDGDGADECAPAATGDGAVGDPCTAIWQCGGDVAGTCLREDEGFPEGFCTIDCWDWIFSSCPVGTHCAIASYACEAGVCSNDSSYCFEDCSWPGDCRDGYTCAHALMETFPIAPVPECVPE